MQYRSPDWRILGSGTTIYFRFLSVDDSFPPHGSMRFSRRRSRDCTALLALQVTPDNHFLMFTSGNFIWAGDVRCLESQREITMSEGIVRTMLAQFISST